MKIKSIEILQHNIEWWLDDESITELEDTDIEHIEGCIKDGCNQGELNHGENEVRGWWKIQND